MSPRVSKAHAMLKKEHTILKRRHNDLEEKVRELEECLTIHSLRISVCERYYQKFNALLKPMKPMKAMKTNKKTAARPMPMTLCGKEKKTKVASRIRPRPTSRPTSSTDEEEPYR